MKAFKSISIFALSALLSISANAQSTLNEPAYANMQRAMGGIISNNLQSRGFSASDPRIYSTLYGVGQAATVAAASGVVGTLFALGTDSLVKWAFGTGTTPITITAPAVATPSNLLILAQGASVTANNIVAGSINTPFTIVTTSPPYFYAVTYFSTTNYVNPNPALYSLDMTWTYNNVLYYVWQTATKQSSAPCPVGTTQNGTQCIGSASGTTTTANQTMAQAIGLLSQTQLQQAINTQTLASMLNFLWQQASMQPGFSGLPYSTSTAIQPSDVTNWESQTGITPTVQTLVTPIPPGSNGFFPSTTTSPTVPVSPAVLPNSPSVASPGGSASQVNLGADPGIPPPTLDQPPSGIFAPIQNLMSAWTAWTVPTHQGICPTWQISPSIAGHVFNINLSEQCIIAENWRSAIAAICMICWFVIAAFIILSA